METLYPASYLSRSNWFVQENPTTEWTKEENKKFEKALATYDENTPDRWLKVAAMIPGKTVWDVMKQYKELEEDVGDIEAGRVPVPGYFSSSFTLDLVGERNFDAYRKKLSAARGSDQERKKGVPWTEEEHRQFLMGLLKYGKGDWRNISRNFVITKTPTQVASHAQKYFIRQLSGAKDKRRPSIHDITTVNLGETSSENSKLHSLDPSPKFPSQPKPACTSRVLLEWNRPNDGNMLFDQTPVNLFTSSQCEITSDSLKQEQILYSSAHFGTYSKPHDSVFRIKSPRHQVVG